MTLEELAKVLDDLKKERYTKSREERLVSLGKLAGKLAENGLGIFWEDSEECYMVYSFTSRKD